MSEKSDPPIVPIMGPNNDITTRGSRMADPPEINMTSTLEQLALRIVDSAAHANTLTALVWVALASLAVTALSLWTLTIVVKALTHRGR